MFPFAVSPFSAYVRVLILNSFMTAKLLQSYQFMISWLCSHFISSYFWISVPNCPICSKTEEKKCFQFRNSLTNFMPESNWLLLVSKRFFSMTYAHMSICPYDQQWHALHTFHCSINALQFTNFYIYVVPIICEKENILYMCRLKEKCEPRQDTFVASSL